ncbi:porphobilinogen deaminase [Phycomyces blakesleeanus]|uniref:hydroxymethylbilane synthase n=2 Tax=Phycomyces blakesleeanus TaxID=4837 RepID=A0A162ULR7_PHYB8|nr:hypothetical protein PHYBLDRAFT_19005 [Phycomyces blakesleeanus NRRL 1555(-)]OAD76962.1 hypothetical protein PHYBLDRAFT_19005 [Phycomyces blakesleeanus NRRL 1555(-)]|eukprot:XP_018295002.1 hypothetical protein PHYBLDRAFT_19005 [Phycomyces blakesleeanus NRRL 1555(-)]
MVPTLPDTTLTQKQCFIIGTRKSQLALAQAELVRETLQKWYPHIEFRVHSMSTTGDRVLNVALNKVGEKSLFTKEFEIALQDGQVDLVVHSLKDLPTVLPPGMHLGAVTKRENPHDAMVISKKHKEHTLATLPKGSVVGTSSLRRVAQLKRRYPLLIFKDIRGNINTRLMKLDSANGEFDAIILAVAGLRRLGMGDRITQIIGPSDSLHAVSQGALGIECREDDVECRQLLEKLNHDQTRIMCLSERSLMRTLEGGCTVPIGVNSWLKHNERILCLRGLVASLDGQNVVEFEDELSFANVTSTKEKEALAVQLGNAVAKALINLGAGAILNELSNIQH